MSIPEHARKNFNTLLRAAANGHLALMECRDASTGEPRYVLAAVHRDDDNQFVMTPFGHLADDDPYKAYIPPGADAETPPPSRGRP